MSIDLFEHNQTAYESAVAMLAETGKAAVIHPTGTGKSFIGFKLCEDNPDKTVCWLSPSDYIFRTQLENLKKTGADVPQNIKFYTYAKLSYLSDTELAEINPDIAILDEFHRGGAEVWGKSLEKFLTVYSNIPVLGMSATNVRYLDNQRDMAEELFDGNIASEMTLGEAIVRGILKAPLYVSTVYSYQKDLEKYTRMSKMPKFRAVRDTAEKYLEELRRTIEKADGLDVIFEKYMPDKCGKYVVFCANREHLDEMLSHVDEWFYKVDKNPKVYKVYSDNPEASGEFADFKADKSENLKLLFCIDMLNEGVHLDDIDGVILFRPTVSPIIYKQQIGRALTAGKSGTPVIFDIINNFENLYSMNAVEQEIACAVTYYNSLGESEKIVTDKFEIIGIVKDCVELFDKLNEAFTAGWDEMYRYAKEYFLQNGNLDIPRRYKLENGLSLGNWVNTQRRVRVGKVGGILTEERIKKLDEIGMQWENVSDLSWNKNFAAAQKYFEENGNLCPKSTFVTESGVNLGSWLSNIRTYKKCGIQKNYLTDERISELDKIGMVWDVPDYIFEKNYCAALEYFRTHGDLDVPADYISESGVRLGSCIRSLRRARQNGTLSDMQIARLDEIGMLWEDKYTRAWENGFGHAKAYFSKNGDLDVPTMFVCEDGFKLGAWIANHRDKSGTRITEERRNRLDSIGMIWKKADPWEVRFALAKKYFEEHGNLDMPAVFNADGMCISKWVNEQKHIYYGRRKGKKLTDEQIKKLESIGMQWQDRKDIIWLSRYEMLKKYKEENGTADVPRGYAAADGFMLGLWVKLQILRCKKGECTEKQVELLKDIGVNLNCSDKDTGWEKGFEHLVQYKNKYGTAKPGAAYRAEDGYTLGRWFVKQKKSFIDGELNNEQIEKLTQIGVEF